MQRQLELVVSIFQTHSCGEVVRQKAVLITPQTGTFTLQSLWPEQVRPPQYSGVVGGGIAAPPQWTSSMKPAMGTSVKKRDQRKGDGCGDIAPLKTISPRVRNEIR